MMCRRRWASQRALTSATAFALLVAPSISGQTIINVPPSPSPTSAGANTIVNLLPGGTLANFFQALDGGILNIQGGQAFTAIGENGSQINMTAGEATNLVNNPGSQLAIQGGRITGQIDAHATVDISGGRINLLADFGDMANIIVSGGAIERMDVRSSPLIIEGLDFAINGVPLSGLSTVGNSQLVVVPVDSALTGVLADGRAFGHYHPRGHTEPFEVTLVRSPTPPAPTPTDFHVNGNSTLEWIGADQSLFIESGGVIDQHFRAGPGSDITLNGGRIQEAIHTVSAHVELNSGTIARRSKFFYGSTVIVNGGLLDDDARFFAGAELQVYGGEVAGALMHAGAEANFHDGFAYRIIAEAGGTVNVHGGMVANLNASDEGTLNIHGGNFRDSVEAAGATVNIHGGAFPDIFNVRLGSELTVHATEIRHNGVLVSGLANPGDMQNLSLASGDILSGVFSNGTPFVLGGEEYNLPSTVKLVQSAAFAPGPTTIDVPSDPAPQGIHNGQTLTLRAGGSLPVNFTAGQGSHAIIEGGTVGTNFEAVGSIVDVTGGGFGTIDAFAGSTVNLGGTAQWGVVEVYHGGILNILGGSGNDFVRAQPGSTLNIAGGLSSIIQADDAAVNITGGTIFNYQQGSSAINSSVVTMSGGSLNGLSLHTGSQLVATGGTLGVAVHSSTTAEIDGARVTRLSVHDSGVAHVRSGNIDELASLGGTAQIDGGALGDSHQWLQGRVELRGYDFQINGVPVTGLDAIGNTRNINVPAGATFSGTLSDGTPFFIAPNDNTHSVLINNGVTRLVRTAIPTLPAIIHVPDDPAPYGASEGQAVILQDGGALGDNFLAGRNSVVQILGGTVGQNFEAERSLVTVAGGTIGNRMDIFGGAQVNMTGGTVGEEIEIHSGGTLNLQGGQIGRLGRAVGGTLNMTGGSLGSSFSALVGSNVTIAGGTVSSEFTAGSGATVNVTGGEVGSSFQAASGSQVSVSGGHMQLIQASSGSNVSITGGNINNIDLFTGSQAMITGGAFGDDFTANSPNQATLVGLNFKVSGTALPGLDVPGNEAVFTLGANLLFTGTLADGTPFAFHQSEGDSITSLKLVRSADLPPGPAAIQVPSDAAPAGVRAGQQLTLLEGGMLPRNFNAGQGSTVHIMGGTVGADFEAVAAVVNIHGGQVGADFDAFSGSQINIFGGAVGGNFDLYSGAGVTLEGGSVARIDAMTNSVVEHNGGQVTNLQASNGSHTAWTGGTIGFLTANSGSTVVMHGADFKINGAPIVGLEDEGDFLQFNVPSSSILTATMSDGTPVVLANQLNSPANNAQIANGTLTLVRSADPGMAGPAFQKITSTSAPFAIGAGQTLKVLPGGVLPAGFVAGPDSKLVVEGGSTGGGMKAFGGKVGLTDGSLGGNFIGMQDLELIITGGSVGSGFSLVSGAHAVIKGGSLPTSFRVDAGAMVDIYGTSFLLNNQPIAGLDSIGDSLLLTTRGQQLKVVLSDGSLLQWQLTSPISPRSPFGFSSSAMLRLHFVPEPTVGLLFGLLLAILFLPPRFRQYARFGIVAAELPRR